MKRLLRCKTCGTTTNSATGKPLYLLGEAIVLTTHNPIGECWECGEKRREKEAKKQKQQARRKAENAA